MQTRLVPLLLALPLLLNGCGADDHLYRHRFDAMGTHFQLQLDGIDPAKGEQISQVLQKDLDYLSFALNASKPGPLGRVNELLDTGGEFSINPSVLPLLVQSQRLYHSSQGLYNPAIGKLLGLWGYHSDDPGQQPPPSIAAIHKFMEHEPSMDDISVHGIRVQGHNPEIGLDFGTAARGYALDQLLNRLRSMGVSNALMEAGGAYKAIGRQGEVAWKVGLHGPYTDDLLGSLELGDDSSIVTVGKDPQGRQVIDPRNGYPARDTASVTVISDQAADAAAAASALYVAGPKQWWQIAHAMGIKYVMLIDQQGNIHMTPAMARRVHLEPKFQAAVKLSNPLK